MLPLDILRNVYAMHIGYIAGDKGARNTVREEKEKEKEKEKSHKKDNQLVIRINGRERDQFIALCDELDTSAAREIRKFIREFLREYGE